MRYDLPQRIQRDICRIAEKNGVLKVILFGSRARGTNSPRSDIDLAARGGDKINFYYDLEEYARTLLMFDVVDLDRHISDELRHELEKDGVVIYEKV